MKIELGMPGDWEVEKVEWNAAKQVLTVTPRFTRQRDAATVCYATVIGDGGRRNRMVVTVNGKNGSLAASSAKNMSRTVPFDEPPEEETPKAKVPPAPQQSQGQPPSQRPDLSAHGVG